MPKSAFKVPAADRHAIQEFIVLPGRRFGFSPPTFVLIGRLACDVDRRLGLPPSRWLSLFGAPRTPHFAVRALQIAGKPPVVQQRGRGHALPQFAAQLEKLIAVSGQFGRQFYVTVHRIGYQMFQPYVG